MRLLLLLLLGLFLGPLVRGQVPGLLHHQGRILVGTTPFTGPGQFKFALVDAPATATYWSNAADGDGDGEPDAAVALGVQRGLYSVLLGDPALANMAPVPSEVFQHPTVLLRVWFNDGVRGFQRLVPDQRVAAVGYAMVAASVPPDSLDWGRLTPSFREFLVNTSNRLSSVSLPAMPTVSVFPSDPALAALGYTRFMTVPAPAWSVGAAGDPDTPSARSDHAAVWDGARWLIWGGQTSLAGSVTRTGAAYDPAADDWKPLTTLNAPAARAGHSGVWTGTQLLVWGGYSDAGYLGDGGAFTPSPQAWTPIPTGPAERAGHAAVWTGTRLLIWGGQNAGGLLSDGHLYSPTDGIDPWSPPVVGGPLEARRDPAVAWTGSEVLLWGGLGASGPLGNGARLTFERGEPRTWSVVSASGAPTAREGHGAVWTGARWLVWGGRGAGGGLLGDGGIYDPVADAWEPFATGGAPGPRHRHVLVWTGTEVLVLGGIDAQGPVASGHAYHPGTRTWRALSLGGSPPPRSHLAAVWTGSELLEFGGRSTQGVLGALQRLDPQPAWHFYRHP